jgi:hypothetical protein
MNSDDYRLQGQIETPKSSFGVCELEGGHLDQETGGRWTTCHYREMTGVEEDILASQNILPDEKITKVIVGCLTQVGPCMDRERFYEIVEGLPEVDRLLLLLRIRQQTLGNMLPMDVPCPSAQCVHDRVKKMSVDLSTVETFPMKNPAVRNYTVTLSTGRRWRGHVMTGRDTKRLRSVPASYGHLTISIFVRTDSLDEKPVAVDQIQALSMKEREEIREAFFEQEGGIDDNVDVVCPDCDKDFSTDLQIGGGSFFFRSVTQRRSRPKSKHTSSTGEGQPTSGPSSPGQAVDGSAS